MTKGKIDFKWSAITAEASLYKTDKSEMGRQFFKNSCGLSPFGKQLIMQVLIVTDILPLVNAEFRALKTLL